MTQTTKDLEMMREDDIISMLLHCVYKLSQDPEYTVISELIYALDKDSLFKLCAAFGGCTIKIPTIQELRTVIKAMLVYQYMTVDNLPFGEACSLAGVTQGERKQVLDLCSIIDDTARLYDEAS